MNNNIRRILSVLSVISILSACTLLAGCDIFDSSLKDKAVSDNNDQRTEQAVSSEEPKQDAGSSAKTADNAGSPLSLNDIPKWNGMPSVEINENDPAFTDEQLDEIDDLKEDQLSSLDSLGRCGAAVTCVGRETMPEGKRGSIGMIKPSGWQLEKYDFVDGKYLYNRCHLIGWQLTGLNAEEKNLITGTRYMNTEGMLPYENEIADYVENTGNHVAYQVEPLFKGKELLARGVHMQAESIEDDGEGVSFNVFCYNVQPDVDIDYMTGESEPADGSDGEEVYDEPSDKADAETSEKTDQDKEQKSTYILNTNTKKYHIPGCRSLNQMKDKNKKSFRGSKEDLQNKGYSPCGNCHP